MNSRKATPVLALLLLFFMVSTASAQARVNIEVNVGTSSSQSAQKHKHKKSKRDRRDSARRDNRRSKRHDSHHGQHTTHTVVHEHVVVHEYAQPEPEPQYYPMADAQFSQLITQIHNEPFSEGKLGLVSLAAQYNYFSSAQVSSVVSALTFSSDKVEAAVMMHPMVLDPQAFYQVFAAFTFESSKREVRARLGI